MEHILSSAGYFSAAQVRKDLEKLGIDQVRIESSSQLPGEKFYLTDSEKAEIEFAFDLGHSLYEISLATGRDKRTVRNHIIQTGRATADELRLPQGRQIGFRP